MSEVKYDMKPVTEKRERISTKRSIFDPVIDAFISSGHDLVEITVEGRKPGYVVTMLRKRIVKRELDIVADHGGGFVYLEKKQEEV